MPKLAIWIAAVALAVIAASTVFAVVMEYRAEQIATISLK